MRYFYIDFSSLKICSLFSILLDNYFQKNMSYLILLEHERCHKNIFLVIIKILILEILKSV